jgi:prepilin signal peptidase PulO-like enzyme (type II secretory pathway)
MIFLFLLGLFWGSFLSVFSYRYPRNLQFISGRSVCPRCRSKISWFDNIPLVSFILLRGRCRHCKNKISWRYPLIELATGIGFALIGLNPILLALLSILIVIFVIDLEHQIIPDTLVFAGLILSLFTIQGVPFDNFFSGFLFSFLLLLIHLLTRGRGMGLGDVKFAVFAGVLLGLKIGFVWLFLAFLTGAIAAIILVLWRAKSFKDKIAFGPFLVIAIPLSIWLKDYLAFYL